MSSRKLARRACDACKIRKIKCDENSPCSSCNNSGLACTWLKQSQPRGPRKLRDSTLQEIRRTQHLVQQQRNKSKGKPNQGDEPDPPPEPSSEIGSLVVHLCMYRVHLYPIWPIIKIERLIASLQSPNLDVEVFALAYALAAATVVQLRSLDPTDAESNDATAAMLEARCRAARSQCPARPPNVTTVRIAYFLHEYHENQEPGGMQSMLYLREAVTIAQMMSLHRESYYDEVRPHEQQLRRRILWQLFMTERKISLLHKQPVTLKTKIGLPTTIDSDGANILCGFQTRVQLYYKADEAGFFDALDQTEFGAGGEVSAESVPNLLDLHSFFLNTVVSGPGIHKTQVFDLSVTLEWLRVSLWRLLKSTEPDPNDSRFNSELYNTPYTSAENLVTVLSNTSASIVSTQGSSLDLTIFEVTRTLIENRSSPSGHIEDNREQETQHDNILTRLFVHLHREPKLVVALHFEALKHGDQTLANMLQENMSSGDADIVKQQALHGFNHDPARGSSTNSPGSQGSANQWQNLDSMQQQDITYSMQNVDGWLDGFSEFPGNVDMTTALAGDFPFQTNFDDMSNFEESMRKGGQSFSPFSG